MTTMQNINKRIVPIIFGILLAFPLGSVAQIAPISDQRQTPVQSQLEEIRVAYEAGDKVTDTALVRDALNEAVYLDPLECLARQRELLSLGQEVGFDGLEPLVLEYYDCAAFSDDPEEVTALASLMTRFESTLWFRDNPTAQLYEPRQEVHFMMAELGPLWAAEVGEETPNTQHALLMNSIYADLRDVEELFPIPQGTETVDMGTFNVATGEFTGKTSQQEVTYFGNKPQVLVIPPVETINAVNVELRFNFQFRGLGPLRVFTNGALTTVPPLQDSVTINLGKARSVDWRIEADFFDVEDKIIIERPEVVGAGAFTVEALPISILYEPPQFGGLLSRTTLEVIESVGSSMSISESHESSETRTKFIGPSAFANKLSKVAKVLGFLQLKTAKTAVSGVATLLEGFGESTSSETEGTAVTAEHTVDLLTTESILSETGAGLGPGHGDRILYLTDVQLAWVMDQGELSLIVLGWGGRGGYTVTNLKEDVEKIENGESSFGLLTGLSEESLRALIELDPLATGGPNAVLPSTRYECKGTFGGDGPDALEVSHTIKSTDRSREVNFESKVIDFKPGWLGILGVGITEAGSTKMKTTHSSTRQVEVEQTVTHLLEINATVDDPYEVNVYYDVVFGTFVAKEVVAFGVLGTFDACGSGPPQVVVDLGSSESSQSMIGGVLTFPKSAFSPAPTSSGSLGTALYPSNYLEAPASSDSQNDSTARQNFFQPLSTFRIAR